MVELEKSGRVWWMILGLVVLVAALAGSAVHAEEPVTGQEPEVRASLEEGTDSSVDQSPVPPRMASGARAHIDPDTGELMIGPAKTRNELQLSPELLGALSTSHVGLKAVKMPNGLTYVDLQGRFKSATIATVGEDGVITLHRSAPMPAQTEATEVGGEDKVSATQEKQR